MSDMVFTIDPEFRRLLPELSVDEMKQLEENIVRDGCRDPIVVWENIIVDGHHRYAICQKHKLPFKVEVIAFSCREEALRWICMNQVGRRNISGVLLRYQIGKRYNVEKVLTAHNPGGRNQYSEVTSDNMMRPPVERRMGTASSVGKDYHVSHFAVHTYKDIATSVDAIALKDSRLSELYLSGQMRIKKDDLLVIAGMSEWQIRALTNALIRQNKTICRSQDVLEALSSRDLQKENQRARERRRGAAMESQPSIKDMPMCDPDSEIAGLSLTIPSWNSSIDRVINQTNMQAISDRAKTQLREELLALRDSVDLVLVAIEEVSNNG